MIKSTITRGLLEYIILYSPGRPIRKETDVPPEGRESRALLMFFLMSYINAYPNQTTMLEQYIQSGHQYL